MRTPWGKAQTVREVQPGILEITTAGHGGFKLSRYANSCVHSAWRRAGGWYEEDCEWAIVALTFGLGNAEYAQKTAKNWYPNEYEAVYGGPVLPEESRVLRERHAQTQAAGKWQVTAGVNANGRPGMVCACARVNGRSGTGPEKFFLIPESEYQFEAGVLTVNPEQYEEVASFG
jgi:hypothetical protein